jgi:hypothetical protein
MELQRQAFCPPKDFLEHSGDPVAELSESNQLRYQELQILATCEILTTGLLGCDAVLLGQQFWRFDSWTAQEWVTMKTEALLGTTRSRPETRRHIAHHLVLQAHSLALSTALPGPQKTRYQLKKQIYSMFLLHVHTCSNLQPNYNKTATGALRDAVPRLWQGVLYFQNAMRFHGRCVLTFAAHETYGLPSVDWSSRSSKTYNIMLHGASATSDNANRNSFMSLSMTVTYDFHETHIFSTIICKELLYRISWKSDKRVSHW